eukprot:jgi/Ulvmu1/626/UM001_0634.1
MTGPRLDILGAHSSPPGQLHVSVQVKVQVHTEGVGMASGNFAIQSFFGTFVRAYPGGEGAKTDLAAERQDWEIWRLVHVGDGKVALVSKHGLFLRPNLGVLAPQ